MFMGGIVAGGIGYAAATYLPTYAPQYFPAAKPAVDEGTQAKIDDLAAKIEALSQQQASDPAPTKELTAALEALKSDVTGQTEALGGRLDGVDEKLGAVDAKITELENRPASTAISEEAIANAKAALEEELAPLKKEVATLADEAKNREAAAEAAETSAARHAALSDANMALEKGAPLEGAIAALKETGAEIPENLNALAEIGVPTLAQLQEDFPDAARAALGKARESGANATAEGGGFGAFLKSQLGARSLEPREGNDPDAVLSRAEAAVRSGDLQTALDEIKALPDDAQGELADWAKTARTRLEAVTAIRELNETLN